MASLLIESRDPLESSDVDRYFFDLAAELARRGETVTLFLVQNGVFPARRSAHSAGLERVAKAGVEILADDFSLRERGVGEVVSGVGRGSPVDFWKMAEAADNTLVIPTKG